MSLQNKNMCKKLITLIMLLATAFTSTFVNSAVILQYHHVSTDTPKSTSISPAQFELHLNYLANNGYQVLPLSHIVAAIKDKTYPNKL